MLGFYNNDDDDNDDVDVDDDDKDDDGAFSIIAISDDNLQHSVQVRDNYWTTVYRQYIKHVIHYKTICETDTFNLICIQFWWEPSRAVHHTFTREFSEMINLW